jgi:hypothetical protein
MIGMTMPKPIKSISTVRKRTAKRLLVGGMGLESKPGGGRPA